MKTILALAALFIVQTAHSEETFEIIHAKADAWVYQQTPDVWALPAEIQLMFNVCLKNHDSSAPLNRFKFVIFNEDTNVRATDETYTSDGSGCFRWYEKLPVVALPEVFVPVKIRRRIRPVDSFKGFSTVAEFGVIPDAFHPSVITLDPGPESLRTISEASYLSTIVSSRSARVVAKKITLRLLSINWKTHAEIAVNIEPFVEVKDWNGHPSLRPLNSGAFTVSPVLIMSNDGTSEALKPVAEGSPSLSYIERDHLVSPVTIRFNSEGFPSTAHFYLGLHLTPQNYYGSKPPVRESDLVCEMGTGGAALGLGGQPRNCQIITCLNGECGFDKYFNRQN